MIPCPRAMDLAQIGTFRTSAMQNAFGLSMNSRRLVDADSAWRDLCEFVSFRTIVGELTLGTRMRRVCRSSCFRRRHVSCVGRHTITIQGCRSGISQRTSSVPQRAMRTYSLFKGVNHCGPYELPAYGNVRCPEDRSWRQFSLATMAARSRKCRCPEQRAK